MKKKTNEEFIQDAIKIHGDKYDYSKVNYIRNKNKVIIICKKHGEFEQNPNSHLKGNGCQKCYHCCRKLRMTTKEFIEKAKKVHKDKYNYSKVIYSGSKNKITIICKEHGDFEQIPSIHLLGSGCSSCGYLSNKLKFSMSIINFIEKSKEVHGDKYDYSKVKYINTETKVIIICKEHGEFEQTPHGHLQGQGCSKCSGKYSYTTDEWIEKAVEVHGDKYDYSKVNYYGNKNKVIIICKEHGEFKQTPNSYIKGSGCSKCSGNYHYNTLEWIEKAKKVHSDKYDYSKVKYIKSDTKVIIICKNHGEFEQIPNSHLRGRGCSKCNLCSSCQLWRTLGKLCEYCNPKNKKKIYEKTKEYNVVKYLREKLPDYDFIHNKSVGAECTKDEKENSNGHLFPDIRFDCDFYHLIVEVDEHKHRGADYKCDEQRMYNIIAKLGLPCIFIRYNPDCKESNKELLLKKIEEYLELDIEEDDIWDDFGFKSEYLFY